MNYKSMLQIAIIILSIGTIPCLLGCIDKGENMDDVIRDRLKSISTEQWTELSQKNIIMGHHSVGYNILDGVKQISIEYPNIRLNIIETNTFDKIKTPVFAHFRVGENLDPHSKVDHFKAIIEKMNNEKDIDIAFFKLCYVDIDKSTDVKEVFNYYKTIMSELQSRCPTIQFIHFTIPLKASPQGFKTFIKRLIGYPVKWTDPQNVKRNEYNRLIIKTYKNKEKIFDLAKLESTFPNGNREYFKKDGEMFYTLVPDYTDDGGHLNEKGRRIIASELLAFLVNL